MATPYQLQPLIAEVGRLLEGELKDQQLHAEFESPWELSSKDIEQIVCVFRAQWDALEIRHLGGRKYKVYALMMVVGLI